LEVGECFVGPNWGCNAETVRALGGFDVNVGLDSACAQSRVGEETDLMERLEEQGLKPWYVPQARIRHFVPAAKSTLKHIAARAEDRGYYLAWKMSSKTEDAPKIFGTPRWMWGKAIRILSAWIFARIRGRKGWREYVRWRNLRGGIAWTREHH